MPSRWWTTSGIMLAGWACALSCASGCAGKSLWARDSNTTHRSGGAAIDASASRPAVPRTEGEVLLAGHREQADSQAKSVPAAAPPAPGKTEVPLPFPPEPKPKSFPIGDPQLPNAPPTANGLSLDGAINTCLVNDPKLRAGLEAINQANADALTASLKPNPTLFTDIQLVPLTKPFTVTQQGGPPQQDINVGYPIDWYLFGKRAAAMASAALGVRVSEAGYADLVRQRVTEVAIVYFDILEAKGLLELAKQDVANLEQVLGVTSKAVENGGRPRVDLSRVRLDLLNSQRAVRDAEVALLTAKARLRALLGQAADCDPLDVAGTLDASFLAEPPSAEDAYALAMQNRPDLQAARWKIAQAQADVDLQRRKAYPEVTPQLGYTRQYQTKAIGFPDANSWSASVTMPLPFSDRNQGNRAKAASVAVQSSQELQSALVNLRAEIETLVLELRTNRANADAVAGDQLKLAGEVRDSINKAYAAGGRPLLDVLDAQRNYRDTFRAYITTRANYWRSVYKYQSAIGQQANR